MLTRAAVAVPPKKPFASTTAELAPMREAVTAAKTPVQLPPRTQTSTSSVKKGVKILAYRDGKIKLRVRTKFFALYGRDPSVVVPADAPAPLGSYFQIRKEFPLDLTLEAPFAFK